MLELLKGLGPAVTDIIWIFVGICLISFIVALVFAIVIHKCLSKKNERGYKKTAYYTVVISYNLFIASVSILPLLGMLGTVLALLRLDLSSGVTDGLQQEFFLALDTTALGLFFSIIFKFVHSWAQAYIEVAITKSEEIMKDKYRMGSK